MLFLHGASGFADELIIAVAVLGVMWLAVRLAGRAPAEDEEQPAADEGTIVDAARGDEPAPPSAPAVGSR